ncbi:MAG: type II secretion system minor pseudopilin GspK [Gammaproteobacteria bacterium]|nr:type II secretion system minor pseudopilin GspK [Gammaproteobacteria bacterium]
MKQMNRMVDRMGALKCGQKGVALITAMLVVALATVAAIAMTSRQQLDIRRTGNTLHADQASLYALGGELWAKDILRKDLKSDKNDNELIDTLDENWAKTLPPTPIEGGQISGNIEDLQARFNLNNLYKEPSGDQDLEENKPIIDADLEYFKRLLRILELEEQLAQAIADWIDPDTNARFPDGSEDIEYLNMQIPYRTGNTRMASPSELRLIKGVTREVYKKLVPFVSTLPEYTPINVNTASAEIIAALPDETDITLANNLIEERDDSPFIDKNTFITSLSLDEENSKEDKLEGLKKLISISSHYFLLNGNVEIGTNQLRLSSMIERTDDGKAYVLTRSSGAYY